jgi:hypothetical protein
MGLQAWVTTPCLESFFIKRSVIAFREGKEAVRPIGRGETSADVDVSCRCMEHINLQEST